MIITLIVIALVVFFIVVWYLDNCADVYINEFLENCAMVSGVVGITSMLAIIPLLLIIHCNVDHQIQLAQMKRESLTQQVEIINSNYEDVSKAQVINNVYEWNKYVCTIRWANDNPLFSWFYNDRYADSLEYIDVTFE